ncbi:protein of unknown function [Magnetospirillum sp. XM-1]|nr:protein of unknown function [Magnetospirillum sp. XM-1]
MQPGAIMGCCIRHQPFADQPMRPIRRNVVLVAEGWDGQIHLRLATVVVNLTPGGRKVTKTLIPWALKFERTAFKDFSQEEIDTLYSMLTRIFENSAELLP